MIHPDREPLSAEQLERMAQLGITHSLIDSFHYRQYHYSNLSEAIAQAEREQDQIPRPGAGT